MANWKGLGVADGGQEFVEVSCDDVWMGFRREVPCAANNMERRAGDEIGCFTDQIRRRGFVAIPAQAKRG